MAETGRNWRAALEEFRKSRELFPTRAATRNAAIALRQLGENVAAFELYTQLLQEFGQTIPPDQAFALSEEMRAVEKSIGELEVKCNESTAAVTVDGVERGSSPLAGSIRLDAGHHILRVTKPGFKPFEQRIDVIGGRRSSVEARLERLTPSGTLAILEADGRELDVLVDSGFAGKTPWRGRVPAGTHSVALRDSNGMGTAPSSAQVSLDGVTSLTLRAVVLDASIRVEPVPSSATVFIDGVQVGSGVWTGPLPSGSHQLEVVAPGHLPFRRELQLKAGQTMEAAAVLERDLSNPLWEATFRPHPYVELVFGGLFARTFHGGADDSCNCDERSRPSGFLGGARAGYALLGGLGIELTGGYLAMSQDMVRRVVASGERHSPTFTSTDYRDSSTLSGPLVALTASYRLLERTPLTARAGFGLAVLGSRAANAGTFSGEVENPGNANERQVVSAAVSIDEADQSLLTPFGLLELRFGYRFSRRWSADAGVGVMLLFVPSKLRAGSDTLGGDSRRAGLLGVGDQAWSDGQPVVAGVVTLPPERVAGTFATFAPTIGLRADF